RRREDGETGRIGDGEKKNEAVPPSPRLPLSPSPLRVHLVRENVTLDLSLEDYVLGVVATEGSMEAEPEALKALAVAVRTYAMKNQGRHEREGFDFCSTTHCQRFQLVGAGGSPTVREGSALSMRFIAAVRGTE